VLIRNYRVGNWLGAFSIPLAVIPIAYIFHADFFPNHALTETVVLLGGVGGSLLAALAAGIVGSRWWFFATLAPAMDVVCLWGFSP
jgi:hypothetical protein